MIFSQSLAAAIKLKLETKLILVLNFSLLALVQDLPLNYLIFSNFFEFLTLNHGHRQEGAIASPVMRENTQKNIY